MFARLEALEGRLEMLDRMLSDPEVVRDQARVREISREHRQVTSIVDAWRKHKSMEAELVESREMLTAESDADLKQMARDEITRLEAELSASTDQIRLLLLPKDPYEGRPLLVEIRAGTGGDEAALFAGDLFRMYQRWLDSKGLKLQVVEASPISIGSGGRTVEGFKEIIASVQGELAYSMLRFESGVHRVQRVPATETQGRIHTSAATIAVLPEPDEIEVKLEAKDLRIDVMRAGGPGGQSVNTTDSAVRIVHIPTGTTVICQDEKSQLKNKDQAMRVLKARLLEAEREKAAAEGNAQRRAMVGSGDRSERIRTYNFPQNRVTDHRIGLTLYQLDKMIDGDLDALVDGLTSAHRAELLSEQQADA